MKLIKLTQPKTKTVEYFGLTLDVPYWANYLATDNDGELWAYQEIPNYSEGLICYFESYEGNNEKIADVDLECLDAKNSLKEI